MYNRYIPQPDGSYRRNRMPDQQNKQAPPQVTNPAPAPQEHQPQPVKTPLINSEPIAGFFKQLLPKGLETGDLIIVLLLLLIAGDNEENRNNALLTLALYFLL